MTDNFVAGTRQNYLVDGGGTRIAAANPADPLPNLSLAFLGDPVYADGRAASDVGLPRRRERLLPAGRAADARRRLRRPRLRARGDHRAARPGCSTGSSPTTTRRTCSASASTRATGSSSRSAWTPTARRTSPPTRQHDGGERCAWSQVQTDVRRRAGRLRRARVARVLLRAGRERARPAPRRPPPRRRLPGGAGARDRHRRRRRSWPGAASGARRRRAPSRRAGRASGALRTASTAARGACTVGATQASATAQSAGAWPSRSPAPRISATRRRGSAPRSATASRALGRDRARRPTTLLVAVAGPERPTSRPRAACVCAGAPATASLPLPPAGAGPYVVSASAFTRHGSRSRVVGAPLR